MTLLPPPPRKLWLEPATFVPVSSRVRHRPAANLPVMGSSWPGRSGAATCLDQVTRTGPTSVTQLTRHVLVPRGSAGTMPPGQRSRQRGGTTEHTETREATEEVRRDDMSRGRSKMATHGNGRVIRTSANSLVSVSSVVPPCVGHADHAYPYLIPKAASCSVRSRWTPGALPSPTRGAYAVETSRAMTWFGYVTQTSTPLPGATRCRDLTGGCTLPVFPARRLLRSTCDDGGRLSANAT
jgi:hypothetical protein